MNETDLVLLSLNISYENFEQQTFTIFHEISNLIWFDFQYILYHFLIMILNFQEH